MPVTFSEILIDSPPEVLPDTGKTFQTSSLIFAEHPDHSARWIPESTAYYRNEKRPLKIGIRRTDGDLVGVPSAANVVVTPPSGTAESPLTPNIQSELPQLEQVVAVDYTFVAIGAYRVEFFVTIGQQVIAVEQVLYVSA